MQGHFAIILHAHLPFVRHPEHERFLEENWLFEAITECYLPLLRLLEGWERDRIPARLTLSLSPTLCCMLQDQLLRGRYLRHLEGLIELAEKEAFRTHFEEPFQQVASFYLNHFTTLREQYLEYGGDLIRAFGRLQEAGQVEIITCAATHAILPLLAAHPPSLRAQILVARDHYRSCFGCDPRGIWLPECAYTHGVETALREAEIRWFTLDTHGVLNAQPRPRYGVFAPVFTPSGVAAFGRDLESARQVWSRNEGYPGDFRYRDFYRDIGFDLDWDYVKPYLPGTETRTFTGIKYHRITGGQPHKQVYDRADALSTADEHARHFLQARVAQFTKLASIMDRPPVLVAPYDAELFGHWWYEGPQFLDRFVRRAVQEQNAFTLVTPTDYLRQHPNNQVATPSPSSWGQGGQLKVWLNEKNAWMHPHLRNARQRMTELARQFPEAYGVTERALNQAARELLLAQSSDWPFILTTGTSPDYARGRFTRHLTRFLSLHQQLISGAVEETKLREMEWQDNLFARVDY